MDKENSVNFNNENVGTDSVKCSSCGSVMSFDPKTQKLYCEHCGSTLDFSVQAAEEKSLERILYGGEKWAEGDSVFKCENCGASVVMSSGETAKKCPFCGTGHVKKESEIKGVKPSAVVPFKISKTEAAEYCVNWAKRKFFAPNAFKKSVTAENVNGVYAPCFTFDSDTDSIYYGRIGETKTRTVGTGKDRRTETYTVWKNISGTYRKFYNDIQIAAGSRFSHKEMGKISPFDTDNSKKYTSDYLLGFMAYNYDREVTDMWGDAKKIMDADLKRSILSQYRYDKLDYIKVQTTHRDVTYKYVMLPVYVGNYTFKQKLYNFFVNGSTGKAWGKTPLSWVKILFATLIGSGLAAAIVYFITQYMS